jgi:fluoride exporter
VVWLLVFVGGGLGSLCRYALAGAIQSRAHAGFPIGTLAVNVIGCLVIGLIARQLLAAQSDVMVRAALVTGFCGGFTTFSAFSYETVGLISAGEWSKAGLYVAVSVLACLAATAIGMGRPLAR